MISQHHKFLRTRKEIQEEKETELEMARIEYIEKKKKIADKYNQQLRIHSTNLSPEILHDCR